MGEPAKPLDPGLAALAEQLEQLPERIALAVANALRGRRVRADSPKELLTKREAARRLGVKPQGIYDLISSGQIEVVPAGAREKVRAEDVARLAREGWRTGGVSKGRPAKRTARAARTSPPTTTGSALLASAVSRLKV